MNNNPEEAAALFQASVRQGNTDPDVFINLAYSYEQLGLYDQGIIVLMQGLELTGERRHIFHFNLGNLYVRKQEPDTALRHYGLAIGSRADYVEAYLNRANTQLSEWELSKALTDYESFILIAPEHELAPDVRRMIAAITDEMQAEELRAIEEKRLAEIEAERRRLDALEAEQRAREEEARRQALLDDILGNLDKAGDESQTLGAGTEDISGEEDDFMRAD